MKVVVGFRKKAAGKPASQNEAWSLSENGEYDGCLGRISAPLART
jgi:hypothetical protein